MHRLGHILLFLLPMISVGQNLVPNGSFENLTNCPTSGAEVFLAPPWRASSNSPDLFNVCGDFGYSVPTNRYGVQSPRSGNGYAGIATYTENWHGQNTREFLKCTLHYPLVGDEEYYVEYYVSQADSFQFATHNLGVTFTDVDTGEFGELLCWPDCEVSVENTSANPLSSKTDWVNVSGTFTAQGGERYIHIGNFRTDDDSEIEFVGGGTDPNTWWNQAAYYIDDVWLSHVDSAHYVGIEEPKFTFSIYPNPSTTNLIIESRTPLAQVWVRDVAGRVVLPALYPSRTSGYATIDVSSLPSGIYLVEVLTQNGQRSVQKVVVE